ncbi:MAG: YfiM family protein [Archangium sp.]
MTGRESLLAVLCPLLLAPLSARGAVSEIPSRDEWFARDKPLHYGVSAGLACAGYAGGALLFDAPEGRWVTGVGVALGAGVAKEIYDAWRGSFFSPKDLTWDVLGTASGLALSWAVDRLLLARAPASQEGRAGLPGGARLTLALSPGAGDHPQGAPGSGRNSPVMLLLSGGW